MLIDKNIYFVHIPRTGGRYVSRLLKENNYTITLGFNTYFKGKEVPHLSYPDYEIYLNFMSCNKFTIIRNPLDKFISAVSNDVCMNEKTLEKILLNQESLNNYLNNMIFNDNSNWYTPQINFLNKELKIYRFENSLGPVFNKWLEDNLNLKITNEYHDSYDYSENLFTLTEKQKGYVKNYYYKDYKFLDY